MTKMQMVKVSHILSTVTSSCDFFAVERFAGETMDDKRTEFWKHVIEYKSGDSGFVNLVNSLLDNGWVEGSCVGWQEDEFNGGYISEGHHRLVAAILLGMDEVPVSAYGKSALANGEHISAHDDMRGDKVPMATF